MLPETDPELREMAAEEVARLEPLIPDRRGAEGAAAAQGSATTKRTSSSKSARARAATRRHCLPPKCSACTRATRRPSGWKVEVTSASESAVGGLKEVIALISGDKVYSQLKYESGVHRVQRVPETEQQGRVHTSAITVAVLPEADEVEVKLEAKDIRIDTFCSSGPGGQSRQHDLFRGAHHAPADGPGGLLPGREVADQEPRQGGARAAVAALRDRAGEAAGRDRRRAPQHGGHGRPQRENPHLQFPAEPRDRPPHRPDAAPARPGDGRQARTDHRSADAALPDRKDEGSRAKRPDCRKAGTSVAPVPHKLKP